MQFNKKTSDETAPTSYSKPGMRLSHFIHQIPLVDLLIVLVGVTLAILLRYFLRSFELMDYLSFFSPWYSMIKAGDFAALSKQFSNYTPAYCYMLYGISVIFPKVSTVTAIKLPSIIFDFICAWYVFRVVRLKYKSNTFPALAAFAILFAPTVVLNGAAWGQIESIYTAAMVAFLYYLIKK